MTTGIRMYLEIIYTQPTANSGILTVVSQSGVWVKSQSVTGHWSESKRGKDITPEDNTACYGQEKKL